MGWFKKKEVKEAEETKETDETDDNEYVSEFDRRYKVDENGNYKYHDTPDDPTKGKTEKKQDVQDDDDDDEMNSDLSRSGKTRDDDDER